MAKASGLSPFRSSCLTGARKIHIWDTICHSHLCSKASTCTSVPLKDLSGNPVVFCTRLESKRLLALPETLLGILGAEKHTEEQRPT